MTKRCMGCMELYGNEFEVCPHCGYVEGTEAEEAIHMNPETLIHDRYIVGKVLGFGGFGVTYIGWDGKLEQKVAIKEYLPSEFSTRIPGQSGVTIFHGEKREQFADGMNKFVEEAKRLAKFQNEPGIVKVFDSFFENQTAYIVMEYLDGETLTERLKRDKIIPEDEAVEMLWPVMQSLKVVHQADILHRDIAPDNIFLTKSGEVKLIDFGASRYATTSHSRSLTVIIKPGYSPEEQYRSRGDQGPHTDVYALAATLYKMITGQTPPDAMERRAKIENQKKELLENPSRLEKSISLNRENAILNAMNVRIEDRTESVGLFMQELNADPPAKRRYGKIKKIDVFHWPLWLKVAIPSVLAALFVVGTLLITGVIKLPSLFSDEIVIPDGIVVVPDVEGMDKDEATLLIEKNSLVPYAEGNVASEYIEAGKIILQTPLADSYLERNGKVVLVVSSGGGIVAAKDGYSIVPYVVWDTKEDAIEKLKQAGLAEPKIEIKSDESVEANKVISQSVESGTEVEEGTQITLVVSSGPTEFAMPDLVGDTEESAKNTLSSKGLVVSINYEKSDTVEDGRVLRQSVDSGKKVKKGDRITLTVSSGKTIVTVADIVGESKETAISYLEDQGFVVNVLENYSNSIAKGKVISQSPDAGTGQIAGSTVTIIVSKGTQAVSMVEVPKLVGDTEASAKSTLSSKGLAVSVNYEKSNTVEEGIVIRQSVGSGEKLKKGDSVTITVSSGKKLVSVNNVTGKAQATAVSSLENQGFAISVVESYSDTVAKGTVIRQSPTAGTSQIYGSTITVYVSKGQQPIEVTFDGNGGSVSSSNKKVYKSAAYGTLPTATRSYYTFAGWYTSPNGGVKVVDSTVVKNMENHTLYAQWYENSVSDWVEESQVPSDAKIIDQKWTYTKHETSSTWVESGSGTYYYASFPSGFSTSHSLYGTYAGSQLTSYDNGIEKRVVSGPTEHTYVYWHWCRGNDKLNAYYNRKISNCYTDEFWAFDAFESSSYIEFNTSANAWSCKNTGACGDTYWWHRLTVYKQTYTNYNIQYAYNTTKMESSTEVTESENIRGVQKWVKYQPE